MARGFSKVLAFACHGEGRDALWVLDLLGGVEGKVCRCVESFVLPCCMLVASSTSCSGLSVSVSSNPSIAAAFSTAGVCGEVKRVCTRLILTPMVELARASCMSSPSGLSSGDDEKPLLFEEANESQRGSGNAIRKAFGASASLRRSERAIGVVSTAIVADMPISENGGHTTRARYR